MKKTKLMRAALLLLVLTLITSCFVGGTFAKYVTKGDSTDTARVAKWGVVITAKGDTFAKEYATDTGNVADAIKNSVVSEDKVVAPGTKGKMEGITITGTPEVAVRVDYVADFKVAGWTVGDSFYCPLQIKVSSNKLGNKLIDGASFNDKGLFENEVKKAISDCSTNYAVGESVTAPSVSWEWPFENTNTTGTGDGNHQTNDKDTALGNAGTAPTVFLKVTTTVSQIN